MAIKKVICLSVLSKFINISEMKNGEVGVTEEGDTIICFRSATEIFGYLIVETLNDYGKFYDSCNTSVTLLTKDESVTLKFFNPCDEESYS